MIIEPNIKANFNLCSSVTKYAYKKLRMFSVPLNVEGLVKWCVCILFKLFLVLLVCIVLLSSRSLHYWKRTLVHYRLFSSVHDRILSALLLPLFWWNWKLNCRWLIIAGCYFFYICLHFRCNSTFLRVYSFKKPIYVSLLNFYPFCREWFLLLLTFFSMKHYFSLFCECIMRREETEDL